MEEPGCSKEEICTSNSVKRLGSPIHDQEPMPKKSSGQKSSRRRSSFVRGRRSNINGIALTNLSSDLIKDIPNHLAPDEKLKRLSLAALEYTHTKLSAEFSDVEGLQHFKTKVADSFVMAIKDMSMAGVFTSAVELSKAPTDVLSIKIAKAQCHCKCDRMVASMNKGCPNILSNPRRQIMETEIVRWEKLALERKQAADNAKRLSVDAALIPIVAPHTYLPNLPNELPIDYQHILNCDAKTRQGIQLMADDLQIGVQSFKAFLNHTNGYLQHHAQQLRKASFQTIQDFDNPKKLIENLTSI